MKIIMNNINEIELNFNTCLKMNKHKRRIDHDFSIALQQQKIASTKYVENELSLPKTSRIVNGHQCWLLMLVDTVAIKWGECRLDHI